MVHKRELFLGLRQVQSLTTQPRELYVAVDRKLFSCGQEAVYFGQNVVYLWTGNSLPVDRKLSRFSCRLEVRLTRVRQPGGTIRTLFLWCCMERRIISRAVSLRGIYQHRTCPSVNLSLYLTMSSIYHSIYLFIYPYIYSSIHHLSIYSSIILNWSIHFFALHLVQTLLTSTYRNPPKLFHSYIYDFWNNDKLIILKLK